MLGYSDLKPEQQAAITRLVEYDQTLMVAGLGFGKAIIGLTALVELKQLGGYNRALVICPLRVATSTWAEECLKWSHIPAGAVAIACGGEASRKAAMASDAYIVVINFESAEALLAEYADQFDAMLVDELTKLKATGGVLFKRLRRWVKNLKWRAGMTATPVAECGEDLYGQVLLLDDGKALGTRKDKFMDTYFVQTDYQGYSFALRPGSAERIAAKLKGLLYRADDASYTAELPLLEDTFIAVALSNEAKAVYDEMRDKSIWKGVVAPNAAVQAGKLAQIAAGGLYGDDKEQRLAWVCEDKLRLQTLADLVASRGEPVIITYTYSFQLEQLMALYPSAPVLGGKGRATAKDIQRFNEGSIPVLIGHPKSMSMGLNLQGACRTIIHLSPIYSADLTRQAVGRIHRRGQTQECHRIVFFSPGTVEDRIITNLAIKNTNEQALMAHL